MRLRRHIGYLLLAVSCWLFAACGGSDDATEMPTEKKQNMLTIYVYSPEHPILTRGDVGPVNPTVAEGKVNKLQIWIFESGNGRMVGYLNTLATTPLNTDEGAVYQIPVDDNFAQNKPSVDVYVLANVTEANCGCAFNENSTRDALKDAKLDKDHFGLSPVTSDVPTDGLPMSGVLRNQPVIGDAPVLRVGTEDNIATVSLVRAVSKLRFVFANTENAATLTIKDIKLNAGVIPVEEYLIPQNRTLTYNPAAASLLSPEITSVAETADPMLFIYDGQEAQAYEELLDGAHLTTAGPYYLHESDKKLAGTITYTIGGGAEQEGDFQMETAGDFLRNHTWIIYAYHTGGGKLQMSTIYVKDWYNKTSNHEVYNW